MEFPEPNPLKILEIGDNKDHRTMTYSVDKPHPGYGKDPNILNEFGHSVYPKMIYPHGNQQPGIIVKNQKEEDEVLGKTSDSVELKASGPTVEEYVAAGYKASEYPPKGYASKSSKEDIEAAIEKEKAAGAAWG